MGTMTAPKRATASRHITHSGRFVSWTATASPEPMPNSLSAAWSALASWSTWPYVIRRASNMRHSRLGLFSACCAKISAR